MLPSLQPVVSIDVEGYADKLIFSNGIVVRNGDFSEIVNGTYTSIYSNLNRPVPCDDPLGAIGRCSGDTGTWKAIQLSTSVPPTLGGVVSGASFQSGCAPNSWVTIVGSDLAPRTDPLGAAVVNGKLPTTLDGVSVSMGGQAAFIAYISPSQINAVAPNLEIAPYYAIPTPVTVNNSGGTSSPVWASCRTVQPAFFQWGSYAVATHLDFTPAMKNGAVQGLTTKAAQSGEIIILWGTGFGPTSPLAPVGIEVPSDTIYYTANPISVTVGGFPAKVISAALSPGYVALYQVAIEIPSSLRSGDYSVVATVSGPNPTLPGTASPSSTLITVQ
jgi:uncharacterized protein (TIGR03437 family)